MLHLTLVLESHIKCQCAIIINYLNSELCCLRRTLAEFCAEANKSGPDTHARRLSKKGEAVK